MNDYRRGFEDGIRYALRWHDCKKQQPEEYGWYLVKRTGDYARAKIDVKYWVGSWPRNMEDVVTHWRYLAVGGTAPFGLRNIPVKTIESDKTM
jgi:hypothetical protein